MAGFEANSERCWYSAANGWQEVAFVDHEKDPNGPHHVRFIANMSKHKRKGKIYVDYLRNAKGATAIAAYSTRARARAPVSVPLAWGELSVDIRSDHFTVDKVVVRLNLLKQDPWRDYISIKQKSRGRCALRLACIVNLTHVSF